MKHITAKTCQASNRQCPKTVRLGLRTRIGLSELHSGEDDHSCGRAGQDGPHAQMGMGSLLLLGEGAQK